MAALVFSTAIRAQDRVNPDALIVQDFEKRVADYVNLQKNLQKGLTSNKPTTEAQAILNRQRDLAVKIREVRAHAPQGAIFSPEISQEFHRLLGFAMGGINDAHIKRSLERAEPVHLNLKVNDAYPANIPLQSTPPTILANLPRLPPELEYRIVGRALVLRDPIANIVVDLIPEAIPSK